MLQKFLNRYVPQGLLPRRYNFEQQLRNAFEHSSGRSIERAFVLVGADPAQVSSFIDELFEKYRGKFCYHETQLDALRDACIEATERLVATHLGGNAAK